MSKLDSKSNLLKKKFVFILHIDLSKRGIQINGLLISPQKHLFWWSLLDRQHSFVEIDYEIFSTVILSFLLIKEKQLSVSGGRNSTILVNARHDSIGLTGL